MSNKVKDKREWSDKEVVKLIELYKENEFLWNVKHKFHKNREQKLATYEEFASKFENCDCDEIQRKIHNLRNQVSHEMQKIKKKKSREGVDDRFCESKWKFFTALQFLVPNFITKRSTSNRKNTHENFNISQDLSIQSEPTQERKRKFVTKPQSRTQKDNNTLKDGIEVMKKPKDDFDRFGEYVAFELRSLKSDYYRGLLKSEIRKAILNISDMDETSYWSTASSSSSTPIASPPVVGNGSVQSVKSEAT